MTFIDFMWICLTVYYEARGESDKGQRAVAKVVMNRMLRKGKSAQDIVLQKKQFSAFNSGLSDSSLHIREIPSFIRVTNNVNMAISEWDAGDKLQHASHYYAIKGMVNNQPPYWAEGMKFICEIEGHRFLREG